jgi:arginine-tRNA-protein transferase
MTLEGADQRFENGERRVGQALYRTECPTCQECKPLRLIVDAFRVSRSQRRILHRWQERGRVEVGPATVTEEKLALYNRHKFDRGLAQPGDPPMTAEGYAAWLVDSCFQTMEMRYTLDGRLVGVGILDLGRQAASSVYFYFDPDPDVARLSPGVFSTLQEIDFCRRTGRRYLYLGLYVEKCRHLNYKADYRPHERWLDGDWRRFD